jgi:hypothetical protein
MGFSIIYDFQCSRRDGFCFISKWSHWVKKMSRSASDISIVWKWAPVISENGPRYLEFYAMVTTSGKDFVAIYRMWDHVKELSGGCEVTALWERRPRNILEYAKPGFSPGENGYFPSVATRRKPTTPHANRRQSTHFDHYEHQRTPIKYQSTKSLR